ncbi:MAG: CD225/dispanin family protein [Pirellulaceae bacterium]|nr:CD225/dispanin family protein [Pirellulaceae bacterium]
MSQFPPSGSPYTSPGTPGQPMPPGTVKNWLVESILSLVCCGGLFAIPALIYASQVNSKLAMGDYQGAVESSNNAKKWLFIAVGIAVVCGGSTFLIYLIAIIAAVANQ